MESHRLFLVLILSLFCDQLILTCGMKNSYEYAVKKSYDDYVEAREVTIEKHKDLIDFQKKEIESLKKVITHNDEFSLLQKEVEAYRNGFVNVTSIGKISAPVGKIYKVVFEKWSWDEAVDRCREQLPGAGAHLAIVQTEREHQQIKNYLELLNDKWCRTDDYSGYWTSGQRLNRHNCTLGAIKKEDFVWKGPPNGPTNINMTYTDGWALGEPNCGGSGTGRTVETCQNYLHESDLNWNDAPCTMRFCPLCQLVV